MPSSPKIPKETILQHALEILIRDGYSALNIKVLATKIGCSTQPISWHFGSMDGLRFELGKYARKYASEKQLSTAKGMRAFFDAGTAYIDIAFDEPNLFKYLYMSADSGYYMEAFDEITKVDGHPTLVSQVAAHLDISEEKANTFCRNMILYTHGLASFVASGLITATKQEVYDMMRLCADGFLVQINCPQFWQDELKN